MKKYLEENIREASKQFELLQKEALTTIQNISQDLIDNKKLTTKNDKTTIKEINGGTFNIAKFVKFPWEEDCTKVNKATKTKISIILNIFKKHLDEFAKTVDKVFAKTKEEQNKREKQRIEYTKASEQHADFKREQVKKDDDIVKVATATWENVKAKDLGSTVGMTLGGVALGMNSTRGSNLGATLSQAQDVIHKRKGMTSEEKKASNWRTAMGAAGSGAMAILSSLGDKSKSWGDVALSAASSAARGAGEGALQDDESAGSTLLRTGLTEGVRYGVREAARALGNRYGAAGWGDTAAAAVDMASPYITQGASNLYSWAKSGLSGLSKMWGGGYSPHWDLVVDHAHKVAYFQNFDTGKIVLTLEDMKAFQDEDEMDSPSHIYHDTTDPERLKDTLHALLAMLKKQGGLSGGGLGLLRPTAETHSLVRLKDLWQSMQLKATRDTSDPVSWQVSLEEQIMASLLTANQI